jgi:hypothetical protein
MLDIFIVLEIMCELREKKYSCTYLSPASEWEKDLKTLPFVHKHKMEGDYMHTRKGTGNFLHEIEVTINAL